MSAGTKITKTTIPFGPLRYEHTVVEPHGSLDAEARGPRKHTFELTAAFAGRAASLQVETWPSLTLVSSFVRLGEGVETMK